MESLISMILLAIILAGGMVLYSHADAVMVMAVHKRMVSQLATAKLESLKTMPYTSVDTEIPAELTVGSLNVTQTVHVVPEENGKSYKYVEVKYRWNAVQPNGQQELAFNTLIAK